MGISTHFVSTIGRLRTGESEKVLLHGIPTGLWDRHKIGG
jgi:hypothetical protein